MHIGLAGVVAAIVFIYFMMISPGFRRFAISMVIIIVGVLVIFAFSS
jgi:hypothetical protein